MYVISINYKNGIASMSFFYQFQTAPPQMSLTNSLGIPGLDNKYKS